MDADYSSALTLLLRYPDPKAPHGPPTFVADALYLQANLTRGAGSSLISKYSGRAPVVKHNEQPYITNDQNVKEKPLSHRSRPSRSSKDHSSPGGSPARFLQQQRGLENLFQEVSGGLQRRSEAWGIARTVRGAVSEVRRNVQGLQSGSSSPRPSGEFSRDAFNEVIPTPVPVVGELASRIKALEDRNKLLAKMLGNALESLRSENGNPESKLDSTKLMEAVARIQFVQVYLEDPSISIPPGEAEGHPEKVAHPKASDTVKAPLQSSSPSPNPSPAPSVQKRATRPAPAENASTSLQPSPFQHPRPGLGQSSYSWMLGEDRHQSSFVTSSLFTPDERRNSDTKGRPAHLFGDSKGEEVKKAVDSEDDGFTMDSLKGMKTR